MKSLLVSLGFLCQLAVTVRGQCEDKVVGVVDLREDKRPEKFSSFSGRPAASLADCSWDFFSCSLTVDCCRQSGPLSLVRIPPDTVL